MRGGGVILSYSYNGIHIRLNILGGFKHCSKEQSILQSYTNNNLHYPIIDKDKRSNYNLANIIEIKMKLYRLSSPNILKNKSKNIPRIMIEISKLIKLNIILDT